MSVVRAWLLLPLAFSLGIGCARPPYEGPSATRIQRELGLVPPIRCLYFARLDDGGTAAAAFVDALGETLDVYLDNRMARFEYDSVGHVPFPPRHVHLHAYPTDPGSLKLEFGSLAESAVVDLLRLAIQGLVTPEQESLLVREQEWALQHRRHVTDAHSSWLAGRTPAERLVLGLRTGVSQIESRRIGGPVGRRPAPNAAAAPRAAPASSP